MYSYFCFFFLSACFKVSLNSTCIRPNSWFSPNPKTSPVSISLHHYEWHPFLTYPSSPHPSLSPHLYQYDLSTSFVDLVKISSNHAYFPFSLPLLQSMPPPFLPDSMKKVLPYSCLKPLFTRQLRGASLVLRVPFNPLVASLCFQEKDEFFKMVEGAPELGPQLPYQHHYISFSYSGPGHMGLLFSL